MRYLGPNREADGVDVFLAASHSDAVNERVAVLQEADLQADVVDLENLAIERACQQLLATSTHQSIAVLDIGAYTTLLYVMRNGQLVYSHEQDFGGQQLTDAIQQYAGPNQAGAGITGQQSQLSQDYALQVLQPFKQKMAQHVARALHFYTSDNPQAQLDSVLLGGDSALLPGAVHAIQQQVGVPVKLLNPFCDIKTSAKVDRGQLQRKAPALLAACGLALRGAG